MRRHSTTRGVALLEAMLSVSLIGVGMLVSMQALGSGASLQSRLEKRAVVRRLVERQMLVLMAQGSDALRGEMSGQFEPPFDGYRWSANAAPPAAQAPFTLLRLTAWRGGEGERRQDAYTLQTLVR